MKPANPAQAGWRADEWLAGEQARGPICVLSDLDGTLLEYADWPDEVLPSPRLIGMLNRLHDTLDGAFAIVSGRGMRSLDVLLRGFIGIRAALHGAEMRHPGLDLGEPAADLRPLSAGARRVLHDYLLTMPQLHLEDKGACAALHHDLPGPDADRVERELARLLAPNRELQVFQGRKIIEIRPSAANKGAAAQRILARPAFANRLPVCLGDDVTDIDLLDAVKAAGGVAIAVGPRLSAHADFCLPSVAAAVRWLSTLQAVQEIARREQDGT